jgi:hypothetical protein
VYIGLLVETEAIHDVEAFLNDNNTVAWWEDNWASVGISM